MGTGFIGQKTCYLEVEWPRFEPPIFWVASECSTVMLHRSHSTNAVIIKKYSGACSYSVQPEIFTLAAISCGQLPNQLRNAEIPTDREKRKCVEEMMRKSAASC